jgi:hypothetical protein
MSQSAARTTAHPRPTPTRTQPTTPPTLWSGLETPQKQQLARLLATLLRRLRTPSLPNQEVSRDK